jgi:hypothetical protein
MRALVPEFWTQSTGKKFAMETEKKNAEKIPEKWLHMYSTPERAKWLWGNRFVENMKALIPGGGWHHDQIDEKSADSWYLAARCCYAEKKPVNPWAWYIKSDMTGHHITITGSKVVGGILEPSRYRIKVWREGDEFVIRLDSGERRFDTFAALWKDVAKKHVLNVDDVWPSIEKKVPEFVRNMISVPNRGFNNLGYFYSETVESPNATPVLGAKPSPEDPPS